MLAAPFTVTGDAVDVGTPEVLFPARIAGKSGEAGESGLDWK